MQVGLTYQIQAHFWLGQRRFEHQGRCRLRRATALRSRGDKARVLDLERLQLPQETSLAFLRSLYRGGRGIVPRLGKAELC